MFARGQQRRWSRRLLLVAAALFLLATAARLASPDAADGVTLLFLAPICLFAAERGWRGGAISGLAAFVVVAVWSIVDQVSLTPVAYATRALAFEGVGAGVGVLVEQLRRALSERNRWFEMSSGLLCVASNEGYFRRVNGAWTETLGYSEHELLGQPFLSFVHPDDMQRITAVAADLASGAAELVDFESRYRAKDGQWHWLLWSARSDGRQIYAVAKDISERKRAEERRLAHAKALAMTDDLTGLPNRRAWEAQFSREVAMSARTGEPLCALMIDLDGLKAINDAHGHQAGSNAIRHAAAAWAAVLRKSDTIARFGGDEFAVLLPRTTLANGLIVAERLRGSLAGQGTASIGIAEWDGREPIDEFLERADRALYAAKHAGRDRVCSAAARLGADEPA